MPKQCEHKGCNNPIWSRKTMRCKMHQNTGDTMKRSPMKKTSGKRQVQENEYSKLRKRHLEKHPQCVCCGDEATQIHHRMQIRYGDFLNDTSQFLSVCGSCHRFIHDNVEHSVKNGYLASKEEKALYLIENL